MKASVVVPAYNAQDTLGECLEAILSQTVPRDRYELIVVDDGSTDRTEEVARQYGVKVLKQHHQGPAMARNLGLREAKGAVILFTDADCAPAPDWLEKMLTPFSEDRIVGVKGAYMTHQRGVIARFAQIEYETKYDRMRKQRYIDFIDACSAAYTTEIIRSCGGFDPAFPTSANEDIDLSFRLAKRGHKMLFAPEAIVFHIHPDSIWAYLKRKFKVGYWRALLYARHPDKVIRDSHTPQSLKAQVILGLALLALVIPALMVRGLVLWAEVALLAGFFSSTIPFWVRALSQDPLVGMISPLLLFLRAEALGIGLVVGFLRRITGG